MQAGLTHQAKAKMKLERIEAEERHWLKGEMRSLSQERRFLPEN